MFDLSFKNGDDDPTRKTFDKYYMKNKQEAYEKLVKMSRSNDYLFGDQKRESICKVLY